MEKVEVTTETRRRWFSPPLAWGRLLPQMDEWLLRHLPPKKLAWGGLTVALIMLAFTWFGGPEMLRPIFGGTTLLWAFMWLTVPTVPVGGRVFTTWAGAAARRADPREITQLQRRGAIIIATCVVFATAWAIYTHDFYTKAYTNFIALGIGTNIAMAQQKWKELKKTSTDAALKEASGLVTIIFLSIVPVALFGLVVDAYMSIEGAGYESGILGWLFHLMPELTVRTVVPPCYDFLSLFLVGYIFVGLHTGARGWQRIRMAAKVTASGVGWLIGFILLGGYVGGWLADIYRTGHGALPDQIRQLLAITVVTRAPSYLIGGFGAAVISGLGAKASTWVRTQTMRRLRPGQSRIVALEERIVALETILGLPTLKIEIANILKTFRGGCEPFLNHFTATSEDVQQIEEIEDLLAESSIAPETLLEIGRNLQHLEDWLTAFRGNYTNQLNRLHGQGSADLVVLLEFYPHFEPLISEARADLKHERAEAERRLEEGLALLKVRWDLMHEDWTTKTQDLMAQLRHPAVQDTPLATELTRLLDRN
ncbi:hypothetical protein KSF_036700 [Reticulibacter mediterranei]|uniref:Uncharacterized protein n=1 Tax=Reticulibacter mediterranei TaxID=2778369 RepID=A0A8J3N161_9CHLR|nr:hypothetical protein KSF_036700 [Reticulibacter mediterranei]